MNVRSEGVPDSYYENPWLPNRSEIEEWGSLSLYPEEAHFILLKAINNEVVLPENDHRALREIIDGSTVRDFIKVRKRLEDND